MDYRNFLRKTMPFQPLDVADAQQLVESTCLLIGDDMQILSTEMPRDQERAGSVVIRGRLLRPSHEVFPRWLKALNEQGYTPILRYDPAWTDETEQVGQDDIVALHIVSGTAPKSEDRPLINLILFLLTLVSTFLAGSINSGGNQAESISELFSLQNLWTGWPFACTLLGILTAHEFGHYFAARYHKVAVTLPYFIPMPITFLGTLGAFIRMKEPVPDLRKLFDIGVAGPLAGLVLAIPLLFFGLSTSPVMVANFVEGGMLEGNSILYYYAKIMVFGQALPNPITGEDVFMNQVTFGAWIGLLVTALNLLPVGQLDGGHTVYALFSGRARIINIGMLIVMGLLAVAGLESLQAQYPVLVNFGFSGWFLWIGMILFVIGPFHPPALDDVTRLDHKRRLIGYLIIVIFILTFVPVPMRFMG